jgi:hypothetical protein
VYYWQDKHQWLIEQYYYAQFSGVTSGITRNFFITQLLPVFEEISRKCLRSVGTSVNDENVEDCIVRIVTHILPRIQLDKIVAAFNFIWISLKHYIINLKQVKPRQFEVIDDLPILSDESTEPDFGANLKDIQQQILDAMDDKIESQKVINKTSTVFLIHMKEYIINNNFDVRGFDVYVQEKMNIKKSTYCSLISRCKIRSKIFNERLLKDEETEKRIE